MHSHTQSYNYRSPTGVSLKRKLNGRNNCSLPEFHRKEIFRKHLCISLDMVYPLECQQALGMENNAISHGHISASSHYRADYAPFNGRLGFQDGPGCWSTSLEDTNPWLQVDLGSVYTKVTRVATQGRHSQSQWVTKYKLQYGDDGQNFQNYTEKGQSTDKV